MTLLILAPDSVGQAAAASLIQRLELEDAVDSSSDILLDTTAELPAPIPEPPNISVAPQPALSQPDRTAISLSNALRDIVHERELALEMRPLLAQVIENAAQSGAQPQDSLAWQLAGAISQHISRLKGSLPLGLVSSAVNALHATRQGSFDQHICW